MTVPLRPRDPRVHVLSVSDGELRLARQTYLSRLEDATEGAALATALGAEVDATYVEVFAVRDVEGMGLRAYLAQAHDIAPDTGPGGEAGEGAALALERRAAERASVALRFPGREIDMPEKIRWRVDENTLGDIVGSAIRVDATATRQLIEEPRYLRQELLPRLIAGGTLTVDVLESVDDERGERFSATLMGLTRALAFADDFVRDGG